MLSKSTFKRLESQLNLLCSECDSKLEYSLVELDGKLVIRVEPCIVCSNLHIEDDDIYNLDDDYDDDILAELGY